MSANSDLIEAGRDGLPAEGGDMQNKRELEMAAAAQAASDAANRNWAHSVTFARTPSRSSEGSLYTAGEPGHFRSSRVDWSAGFGLIGGLMALVVGLRGELPDGLLAILPSVALAVMAGAVCGVVIHTLVGLVRYPPSGRD